MTDFVKREEFIIKLSRKYKELKDLKPDEIFDSGLKDLWLESEDLIFRDKFLERRNAARIVHEFLKRVLKEPDEDDISDAKSLKDLYDCHVCTAHIAQVYTKRIMGEKKKDVFGLTDYVNKTEATDIVDKVYKKENREERQRILC